MTAMFTPHFSVRSLTYSETAEKNNLDNTPSLEVYKNLTKTAGLLERVRAYLSARAGKDVPINVHGYRCEAVERIVCVKDYASWCEKHGKPMGETAWNEYFSHKAHPAGRAADCTAPAFGTPEECVRAIAESPELMSDIDQIITEGDLHSPQGDTSAWFHIAWSESPRHMVMVAAFDKQGTPHYSVIS